MISELNRLRGLGTALITPFCDDGSVDETSLMELVRRQIESRVDFLVVLGTTSEAATLMKSEKQRVEDIISRYVNKSLPLVLGLGGNDTHGVVEEIGVRSDYLRANYSALLSVCPYYNKPSQEGLFRHFSEIAEVSPIPIILYNVPSRTGVALEPETIIRLWQAYPKKIIGIKETSDRVSHYRVLSDLRHKSSLEDHLIFGGEDGIAAQVCMLGGDGLISVASNLFPKAMRKIVWKRDWRLQGDYEDFFRLLFKEGNPTGIKCAMSLCGVIRNNLRLPLVRGSKDLEEAMSNVLKVTDDIIID